MRVPTFVMAAMLQAASLAACTPAREAAPAPSRAPAPPAAAELRIELKHGSEAERRMAAELRAVLRTYDVEPWILTRHVIVDQTAIPHSHPVLTIHTRHLGSEGPLLSTFLHEQLHWLEAEPWLGDFTAAMDEFRTIFPTVPSSAEGGAMDDRSTYRHLLVCDMELQALTALLGEAEARAVMSGFTHYRWIYGRVLGDPRIRQVALRHGFDVRRGTPER